MARTSIALIALAVALCGCNTGSRSEKTSVASTDTRSGGTGNVGSNSGNTGNNNGNNGNGGSNGDLVGVSGIVPSSGSSLGGTEVTIRGKGFTANTQVTFGSTPAANTRLVSPTELVATTGATPPGVVDLEVRNGPGDLARLNNAFTFVQDFNGPLAKVHAYGDPSAQDQELLELINTARKDPAKAGQRLGIDMSSYPAKPPLTHTASLGQAAHAHSKNMAARGVFDHVINGSGPTGRILDSGYKLNPEYGTDRADNFSESIIAGSARSNPAVGTPQQAFDAWMIDANVNPPKHRDAILGKGNLMGKARESGMGFESGLSSPLPADVWVTTEFARSDVDKPFLTGVVFNDDGDGIYRAGEGRSGVVVKLTHGSGFSLTTTTKSAGGYAFEFNVAGTFTVEIDGQKATVVIDKTNAKVDSVSGRIVNNTPTVQRTNGAGSTTVTVGTSGNKP